MAHGTGFWRSVVTAGVVALAGISPVSAAEPELTVLEGAEITLDAFAWQNRVLVIFADSPADPRFTRQIESLRDRAAEVIERDIVVIADTDPASGSALRDTLRPRGFMLVLIGKDGQVKLRKPQPWDVRELTRVIDKDPLRQQEMRERRADPAVIGR